MCHTCILMCHICVHYLYIMPHMCTSCLVRPRDHRRLDRRLVSPATVSTLFWLPSNLRSRVKKYFGEIGSLHSESEDGQTGDVFGKNGAINAAYMISVAGGEEENTSNISTYDLHVMGDA